MKTLVKSSLIRASKEVNFNQILVVYKSLEGFWKGFAHSYDVTTQATTKEKTLIQLRELVKDYEELLGEYGNPEHLLHKPLTDSEDRQKFDEVIKHLSAHGVKTVYSNQTENFYVETTKLHA